MEKSSGRIKNVKELTEEEKQNYEPIPPKPGLLDKLNSIKDPVKRVQFFREGGFDAFSGPSVADKAKRKAKRKAEKAARKRNRR